MTEAIMHLPLDEIVVPDSRRAINPEIVKRLAGSIKEIGLQHPITVRTNKGQFILIAGRHRLEAVRSIGEDRIAATVVKFDATDAELWEISENLDRAELSVLERATLIDRWRALKKEKVAQVAPPSRNQQPAEQGIRATAAELGVERREVQRAAKIATITPEAQQAAISAGLDDNANALLDVASEAPARQVERIAEIAAEKSAPRPELSESERQFQKLMEFWDQCCEEARNRFLEAVI